MREKKNIFLIGPMGAGKSTIGKQLANKLNCEFFDSDKEIEKSTGADITWVFDVEGEDGFRNREEKIINELTKKHGIILATGGGSIISRKTRTFLSSRGTVVYLKTTVEKQFLRTQKDKKRPLLQGNSSRYEVLQTLANERNSLYEEIADIIICTDELKTQVISNKIINLLDK